MTWRKLSEQIAKRCINVGFVESEPVGAQVAKFSYYPIHEKRESLWSNSPQKSASLFKPLGMRKVVQGDERPHACATRFFQQSTITMHDITSPIAIVRLNAPPIYRNSDCIKSEVTTELEISPGFNPPVAAVPISISRADTPLSFPVSPLIEGIVTFELVRAGRYAPEKAGRKGQHCEFRLHTEHVSDL
jgi:hypothetical protein